jgi:hypothetical protein
MTEEERAALATDPKKCAVPMTGSRVDSAMSAPAQARSIPLLLVELGAGAMSTPVPV